MTFAWTRFKCCGAKSSLNTAFCRSNKVQWLFKSFNWYLCTHLNAYLSAQPTHSHNRTQRKLRPQTIHQWLQIHNDLRSAELEPSLALFLFKWSLTRWAFLSAEFFLCVINWHSKRNEWERERKIDGTVMGFKWPVNILNKIQNIRKFCLILVTHIHTRVRERDAGRSAWHITRSLKMREIV